MSDFKEDPSEWAESDEREIRPGTIVLRGREAQEAGRAMLAWAGYITAEQVEAAARVLHGGPDVPPGAVWSWEWTAEHYPDSAEGLRSLARAAFTAAGFQIGGTPRIAREKGPDGDR